MSYTTKRFYPNAGRWAKIFVVAFVVLGLHQTSAGQAQGIEEQFQQGLEEGLRIRQQLKEERRAYQIDQEIKQAEERDAQLEAERQFELENKELIALWDYYGSNERDRETSKKMFLDYLESHPETPFRGEIYFYIGTLYSTRLNPDRGDSYDTETAESWFEKSVDCYDGKYAPLYMTALSSLCNMPKHKYDIEYKKEFYEYLVDIAENGTREDMHPYRSISQFLLIKKLAYTPEEMDSIMNHERQQLEEVRIRSFISNVKHFASLTDAINLAHSYPDLPLGQEAQKLLDALDQK